MERTEHMTSCENRETRTTIGNELWKGIYELVKQQRDQNQEIIVHVVQPEALKPFSLRNGELLSPSIWDQLPAAPKKKGERDAYRNLRSIALFHDEPARLGLIPAGLVGALMELGVASEAAASLADTIAVMSMDAVVEDYRQRCNAIAVERDIQKTLKQMLLCNLSPLSKP
jgi:hypothetical protein